MKMEDDQWSKELSDYYRDLSLSDGARKGIEQLSAAAAETRRWKQIAGMLAAACIALAALATVVVVNRSVAPMVAGETQERPRTEDGAPNDFDGLTLADYDLVAIRIHRDWCGKCKKMGNVFAELQRDLSGRRILFLTFDLTDSETTRQSLVLSDRLAISQALQGIESGNIVLLNTNGQRIETLDGTAGREYLAMQIDRRL